MQSPEDVIAILLTAVTQGDKSTLATVLADHVIFHFPGKNRFTGEYFGKISVMEFWSAHHATLTPLTLQSVGATEEQVIAIVALQAHLAANVRECPGTCVFRVANGQIEEWWYQLEDQAAFDAFWSYSAATA